MSCTERLGLIERGFGWKGELGGGFLGGLVA